MYFDEEREGKRDEKKRIPNNASFGQTTFVLRDQVRRRLFFNSRLHFNSILRKTLKVMSLIIN